MNGIGRGCVDGMQTRLVGGEEKEDRGLPLLYIQLLQCPFPPWLIRILLALPRL